MSEMRLQVDDEYGTTTVYLETEMPPKVRAVVDPLVDRLLADVPPQDRDLLVCLLIRQVADEQAYERVCAQRGLLL